MGDELHPTIDKLKIILYNVTNIKGMMSVSYFRLPVPQRAITKPLVWRLWKENRLVVRHAAMIRDYWVSSFSRSQSGCNMCKVSFADNSETVGHTGIARLCCSQRTTRTRTDCLLLQEEAPASSGGGGCHNNMFKNGQKKVPCLRNKVLFCMYRK